MRLTTKNYYDPVSLFDEFFTPFNYTKKYSCFMSTDISVRKGNYEIDIDIPGYNKDDLKVQLQDGYLTVMVEADKSTTKCDKEECEWIQRERQNGKYSRTFYLGVPNESKVEATYHNGVLTVVVPVTDNSKDQPKYININ